MSRNPPMNNLLNQSQAQNWNASIFALMQMGVVGVGVNPPKKTQIIDKYQNQLIGD